MSLQNNQNKQPDSENSPGFAGLVGQSSAIQVLFKKISRIASSETTVLITGESGTGKELIARAIHHLSRRSKEPMITINCGAIPSELLESELFGHEKGAFTGAHKTRIGRFEMAAGGTIFLDEIGDMNPMLQVKLLRAIQEQTFERVGGEKPVSVDIRIISATNKNLKKAVEDGSFREDLFYRLNVIPLHVPPLRERKGDILLLCSFFLECFAGRMDEPVKKLTDKAAAFLGEYLWPGNVRELENLMERLSVMVDGDSIDVCDLPENVIMKKETSCHEFSENFFMDGSTGFHESVEIFQKNLILSALDRTGWVKAKAAELLKMNRTTLVEKIKKLGLESDDSQHEKP